MLSFMQVAVDAPKMLYVKKKTAYNGLMNFRAAPLLRLQRRRF